MDAWSAGRARRNLVVEPVLRAVHGRAEGAIRKPCGALLRTEMPITLHRKPATLLARLTYYTSMQTSSCTYARRTRSKVTAAIDVALFVLTVQKQA